MVRVQQLAELEEVIIYKTNPGKIFFYVSILIF